MKDIILLIPNETELNNEYVDNLLLLIELSNYIKDDNIISSIEERLNAFTKKYIKLDEIPNKLDLYYEFSEYKNENLIYHSCYIIKCDI